MKHSLILNTCYVTIRLTELHTPSINVSAQLLIFRGGQYQILVDTVRVSVLILNGYSATAHSQMSH